MAVSAACGAGADVARSAVRERTARCPTTVAPPSPPAPQPRRVESPLSAATPPFKPRAKPWPRSCEPVTVVAQRRLMLTALHCGAGREARCAGAQIFVPARMSRRIRTRHASGQRLKPECQRVSLRFAPESRRRTCPTWCLRCRPARAGGTVAAPLTVAKWQSGEQHDRQPAGARRGAGGGQARFGCAHLPAAVACEGRCRA